MDAWQAREHGYLAPGEVAGLLGVTPRTVHFYEEAGLVTPRRSARGTRFYTDGDLRRLEVCVRLACLGVPLRTLRELAQVRTQATIGAEYGRALADVLAEIRGEFRAAVAAARQMLDALDIVEAALADAGEGAAAATGRIASTHSRAAQALWELTCDGEPTREAPAPGRGDRSADTDPAALRRTS